MLPVQFTPKHEVVTYDWEIHIIDSDKLEEFQEQMEKSKFIRIWFCLVASSSIKVVRPAKQEISVMEKLLSWETEKIRQEIRKKVRDREKDWLSNTAWSIENMIRSLKGEEI